MAELLLQEVGSKTASSGANNPFQITQQPSSQKEYAQNYQKTSSQVVGIAQQQRPQTSNVHLQPVNSAPYQPISLTINKIIGTTSTSENNFIVLNSQVCAYLCQSFLVLYDFKQSTQLLHFQNPNHKPYKALEFDHVKSLFLLGEGNSKQGEIHVLRLISIDNHQQQYKLELSMVFKGHKYGIDQIKCRGDLVLSLGDENDKGLIVWELQTPRMLSANLFKQSRINGVAFIDQDNSSPQKINFVTFGSKDHLKLWTIEVESDQQITIYEVKNHSELKSGQTMPKLNGLKLILPKSSSSEREILKVMNQGPFLFILAKESERSNSFLFKFNLPLQKVEGEFKLPYSRELYGMTLFKENSSLIITGGSLKRIQVYDQQNLRTVLSSDFNWAQPPQKGQLQMMSQEIYDYLVSTNNTSEKNYASIKALIIEHTILVQILEDGMILVHDFAQKKLLRVLIQHSDTINDMIVKEYQSVNEQLSYFTCSKDGTLRLWNTSLSQGREQIQQTVENPKAVEGDLKRTVYIESQTQETTQLTQNPEDQGIKCLAYNPMRNQLAVGDMLGNLRLYQLSPDNHQYLHQVNFIEAHEGKIIALQYSEPFNVNSTDFYVQFLVSASSDRMIHIFNAKTDDYELLQTIDAHTTSIVDAKFISCSIGVKNKHKIVQYERQLRLYTCSSDKTLLTHKFSPNENKFVTLAPKDLHRNKIYKLALTEQHLILAKDQGIIEVKSIDGNMQLQSFQQQGQTLMKSMLDYVNMSLSLDNQLLVLNDKAKSIQIREARKCSTLLAKYGLAENLSSLQLTGDNQYLICSSQSSKEQGSGLIYIFKVEHSIPAIKKDHALIQQQRNADKVIVVDSSQKTMFDMSDQLQIQQTLLQQQRKFTVREDLFNTWAKSTTTANNQSQKHQTIPEEDDHKYTQDQSSDLTQEQFMDQILGEALPNALDRRSTFSPPSKKTTNTTTTATQGVVTKNSWLLKSPLNIGGSAANQPQPDSPEQKSMEDFINELGQDQENLMIGEQTGIKAGQASIDGEGDSQSSSEVLRVQEMPDEELQKKVAQNMSYLNNTDKSRGTFNFRNSLTMRHLIETPRGLLEQEEQKISESTHHALKSSTFSQNASQVKDKSSLFAKIDEKLNKILTIASHYEEVEVESLNLQERIKIAGKLNKAVAKLNAIQAKFLEQL